MRATGVEECTCDCHQFKPGTVHHIMPCCYSCPKCGRNISTWAYGSHLALCKGFSDRMLFPTEEENK